MNVRVSLNKLVVLLFIFFILPAYSFSQTDSIEDSYFESIAKYQERDSFNKYFDEINKLRTYYKKHFGAYENKSVGKKERIEHLLVLFEKFKVYREPITIEENHKVRKYYYALLYWTKNGLKNNTKALSIGIKAEKYIGDPVFLDTFSYNIERQIGVIYNIQGDYSRALLYFDKCLPGIIARKNYRRLSYLYSNIGETHKRLRNYNKAKTYFQLGIQAANEIDCLDCLLANKTKTRDLAYAQRDYKLFLKLVNEDKKLLQSYNQSPMIRKRLLALDEIIGSYYYNHEQYSLALPLFQKVKAINQERSTSKVNRDLAKINLKIAQCHNSLGEKEDFKREIKNTIQHLLHDFNSIIPPDSTLYAENTFMEIFEVVSYFYEIEFASNKSPESLDTSLMFLEKAIKIGELLDEKIIYSDSKSFFVNQSKKNIDKAVELAFKKHNEYESNIRDWYRIRNLFNVSKDQILKDKIDLQEKIKNLDLQNRTKVDSLISKINSELVKNQTNKNTILACHDEIEKLTGVKINAKNQIELNSNYLEYLITKENVFLLSRIDSSMQFLKLGSRKEFHSLSDTFNQEITTKNNECKTKLILSKLTNFLIPNKNLLPRKFTIIPDERITTIPFDLLIKNDKYLIEDYSISVSTHYLQKPPKDHKKSVKLLCVNPKYTTKTDISHQEVDRSGFYPLPFADTEVSYIKSVFPSSCDVENKCNSITISEKLKDATIFHFTGHAKVNKDSAYLVLNDYKGINKWSYEQIYHNNFDLTLVTLSACETGLGKVQYGDGLNSVARSFLGAGADAVVYSLWTVNDLSTSTIMKDFYKEMNNGVSKNEAIRQAKLKYYRNANPERRHPYYWGGFVATGDMSPIISISNNPFESKYLLAFGIIALVLFFLKTLKSQFP